MLGMHMKKMREVKLMAEKYIPLSVPDISQKEIANVIQCLKSGWLSTGKFNTKLEKSLADYFGAKEVICLDSCTAALHLSLIVKGIGRGDEVITSPLTFAATANVIEHCGAKPVLCDIDIDSYNIDPELISKKITKRTRAIIPVHFAGYPCDLKTIYALADKYGIAVIEDAAHAIGSSINGRRIGSFPGITCFSFYATKGITTGEGGCLTLSDKKIAEKIRILRYHGLSKDAWKRYAKGARWRYNITEAGYKHNMSDVLAAIGVAQIKRISGFLNKRKNIAARYSSGLNGLPGFVIPKVAKGMGHSWHLYPCRISRKEFGLGRDELISRMSKMNIGTSVHYIPLHIHSYYRKKYGFRVGDFPVAEKVGDSIVSIPIFATMTQKDTDAVIKTIKYINGGQKSAFKR